MVRNLMDNLPDWVVDLAAFLVVAVLVGCLVTTTVAVLGHSSDLATTSANTSATTAAVDSYLHEQTALANAGKEQDAFALWLVETNDTMAANQASICAALHITCQALPPLPKLQGLK